MNVEKADLPSKRARGCRQFLKRRKSKSERRKFKKDPERIPTYGRYSGWAS